MNKTSKLIGILLLKDIFHLKKGKIINYIKRVPLISSNSILSSALEKMRAARAQMGFVVENNNSTDVIGIITIEDIIRRNYRWNLWWIWWWWKNLWNIIRKNPEYEEIL
ncbi:CBS domain-containing protein [Mycoplasmopsis felis]|uniref:CBS domain-containing protein n=1 Tax=Mycoplasmopsis felis TaxID=33923 RepID=UPI0021E0EF39|nr:CBS domain-containing protein [Mycoplasmopsis felis]MCU9931618.1 CBS domain-containing protein [Mycoplasmopsis felis]